MEVRHSPDAPVVAPVHSHLDLEGPTFHELLFEWMQRAPWLAISLAAHVIVLLVLSLVPWDLFEERPETVIVAKLEQPVEEVTDDPPDEPEPEILPEKVVEEPVIIDDFVVEPSPVELADDSLAEGDLESFDPAPFQFNDSNNVIGVGAGAGDGHFGDRFKQGRGGPRAATAGRARTTRRGCSGSSRTRTPTASGTRTAS